MKAKIGHAGRTHPAYDENAEEQEFQTLEEFAAWVNSQEHHVIVHSLFHEPKLNSNILYLVIYDDYIE